MSTKIISIMMMMFYSLFLQGFTGIDQKYEVPEKPEVTLKTDQFSVQECCQAVVKYLQSRVSDVNLIANDMHYHYLLCFRPVFLLT